jgi:two-component system, response regulator
MRTAVDILLAEDSDDDALLTLQALRRTAPELRVLRVKDGEQVLQFLFETGGFADRARGLPRLVLLDLQMPRTDGLQTLRAIREQPETRELPVVLMSSTSNPLMVERAQQLGANEYCIKPVDADWGELANILGRWLVVPDTPRMQGGQRMRSPMMELDPLVARSPPPGTDTEIEAQSMTKNKVPQGKAAR